MIAYNFICAVVSLYCVALIIKALIPGWPLSLFSLEHNEGVKYAMLIYWSTKIFELMDTVFMILRHRHRQISFLHVSVGSKRLVINCWLAISFTQDQP